MPTFSGLELLIFDLDGTLVNSQFDLQDAVNDALQKLNREPIHSSQITGMLGGGIRQLIELSLGLSANEETRRLAMAYFKDYYSRHFADKTRPYPGVRETLEALSSYKKAVLSNKVHAYTTGIIRKNGLEPYFELVLGAQPDLYGLKPDPGGLAYILDNLDIAPEKAMMVGDSTHDIEAAQALGLKTCAVTYGYRSAELLQKAGPDLMIDEMSQLADALRGDFG